MAQQYDLPGISTRMLVCDGYDIHIREAGRIGAPCVLLVHGFSHNGSAFLPLMRALADTHHVVAPDMPGRGLSQWARAAASEYAFVVFERVLESLVAQLDLREFAWVGTSMGGVMGIRMAGGAFAQRIRRLVLNDIGFELPAGSVEAMLRERRQKPEFECFADFRRYLTDVYASLSTPELTDSQWAEFCLNSARRTDAGRITIHHDPAIYVQFESQPDDFAVRNAFERIRTPITLFHAMRSGVLTEAHIHEMRAIQPSMDVRKFPYRGHALFLSEQCEIDAVRAALRTVANT